MLSYLLEYAVIFIGICCHMYWNMLSYLLEYVILFIKYVIIFIYFYIATVIKITSKTLQA